MRINEILSEVNLNRRDFIRGASALAGASGLGVNPAAMVKSSNILEIIKGISFTKGQSSFEKLKKLLDVIGLKNIDIIQQIKSYFDRQNGPGNYSLIPDTQELLTNDEQKKLAEIISQKIGRTITYDQLYPADMRFDPSDIIKIFPQAKENIDDEEEEEEKREDSDLKEPKTIEDYSDLLRFNPPQALKLLGVDTEAYNLQAIVKELAKKKNGIEFDDWHDGDVTNRLFPAKDMPNPKLTRYHRFWDPQATESLDELWRQQQNLGWELDKIKYEIDSVTDLHERYKPLRDEIMNDYNKLKKLIDKKDYSNELNYDEILQKQIEKLSNGFSRTNIKKKFELFKRYARDTKNKNEIFDKLEEKLSKIYNFLDSSPYTTNQKIQQKYIKDLEIEYKKLRNEYFNLPKDSMSPAVKELEKKLDAVLVSLDATKDIGLDLMERLKKQRR